MSCFTANVQSLAYQKTMTPINKMTVASDDVKWHKWLLVTAKPLVRRAYFGCV